MYKSLLVVVVVVLLLGTLSAGFCQFNETGLSADSVTARWMAMGATGTASSNDVGAIDFNPANLATMDLAKPPNCPPGPLSWQGTLTWGGGTFDEFSPKIGVVNQEEGWGAAVSYEHASRGWIDDILQLGGGYRFKSLPLSLGVSYEDWDGASMVNAGVLYEFPMKTLPPVRLGAAAVNLFNQWDESTVLNGGISFPLARNAFVALDVYDITSVWESFISFGGEYRFDNGLALRAGDFDGAFTGGAGYRKDQYALDVAFNNWPGDWGSWNGTTQWTVTGSVNF